MSKMSFLNVILLVSSISSTYIITLRPITISNRFRDSFHIKQILTMASSLEHQSSSLSWIRCNSCAAAMFSSSQSRPKRQGKYFARYGREMRSDQKIRK